MFTVRFIIIASLITLAVVFLNSILDSLSNLIEKNHIKQNSINWDTCHDRGYNNYLFL